MMHKAWSSIEELPYCFSRSSVNFQGHIALKIVEFDPNWAFPDCNSSLNAPMAMKCCTKLETAKKRCPIVFQGHPSDFKVTGDKTSPILTQIRHFRTIGRSQLSNPPDLPCLVQYTSLRCQVIVIPYSVIELCQHWRNGLAPVRHQAITWTNEDFLSFGPLGTNLNKSWIQLQIFCFQRMYLKMSYAKWWPFSLGINWHVQNQLW